MIIQTIDVTLQNLKLSDYGAFQIERYFLKFRVKGCYDAFIKLLSSTTLQEPYYYIGLGEASNTRSTIWRKLNTGKYVDHHLHNGIMNCSSFQPFWISWGKGSMRVGSGNVVGDNAFLFHDDMCMFSIREIVINSLWGATVDWTFYPEDITTQAASSSGDIIDAFYIVISDCPTFEVISTFKEHALTNFAVQCWLMKNCKGFKYNKESEVCILSSETAINGTLTSIYRLVE
ncbi:Hypothetical predicted protein [Mytilus galloprovincialis]|uniref:Farnesoic acid O-methyl transferase domain-containing protein n=1 Tax=Mytilus galloprovincialis TaxID=29158 RepID=A0A8B6F077_MYTGA|nr:Hypothetical predicted protein [Mytilus galloprovincialis]